MAARHLGIFVLIFASLLGSPAFADVAVVPKWVVPTRRGVRHRHLSPTERTQPVIVGDIVYFANLSGDVFAYHRVKGYVLWEKKKLLGPVNGALAYGRSKLFVGDTQGRLLALNARDGSVAWEYKVGAEWLSPPLVVRGRVFAATSSDELYALAETDGRELWQYSHRGDEKMTVQGTTSPVAFGSDVYMGFSDGFVAGLSARKGRVLWTKQLRTGARFYDVDARLHADEKTLVASSFDGRLYSLDRLTGETNWVFPVGTYGGVHADGDSLYFAGLDGHFYGVSRGAGTVLWKTPFDQGVGLAPASTGGHLIFTTSGDPVYIVEAKSGEVVWKGSLGTGTQAPAAAFQDGWFYCMSNYGNLYSFRLGTEVKRMKGPKTIPAPSAIHRLAKPGQEHRESS